MAEKQIFNFYLTLFPNIKPRKLSKEELTECVRMAKMGNEDAYHSILGHMHNYLCYITKEFFIQGSEPEDVYQEGAIKLLNVIEKYDNSKGSFVYFAQSSIRKHIITSLNRERAKKRAVLNNSFSLDDETRNKDGETISYMETISEDKNISSSDKFPLDIIQRDYEEYLIEEVCKVLSTLEGNVFILRFMEENSYKEIAEKLGLFKKSGKRQVPDQKAVDNAIWRSRPKIKKVLEKLKLNPKSFDKKIGKKKKSVKERKSRQEKLEKQRIKKELKKPIIAKEKKNAKKIIPKAIQKKN